MKIRELLEAKTPKKIEPSKPRNFVVKNQQTSGAGVHKDKKKAMKQGDVKHKSKEFAEGLDEVSLGDYRKKAAMQKAQSQMGAMFARDPAEREKNISTFNKREKGLNRLKARDDAARKAELAKKQADDIANLPKLKAEYERMKAEYKSLGGSNWQYADREQNLSDYERKARSMEGPMNNLWRQIQAAEKAQQSNVGESASAGATSAANVAVGAVYKNKPAKAAKNKDGTVKNALDMKANLMTGGSIKR